MAQPAEAAWRLDPDDYRAVMASFATGVAVVTTSYDRRNHGMAVNSLTSVSLDPPLVLFCCNRRASLHDPLLASGAWGVSVLRSSQRAVAQGFASSSRTRLDPLRQHSVRVGSATGAPLVSGSLAWLECRTWATYDGGDHTIVVGEVLDLALGAEAPALLYFRSGYRRTHD